MLALLRSPPRPTSCGGGGNDAFRTDGDRETLASYLHTEHAALVTKHAATLRIRRYVQSVAIQSPLIVQMAAGRGWPGNADATAEIWWDSHDDMVAAFSSPQGQAAGAELAADEAVFCEPSSVTAFLVEEHIVIDNPA